MAAVLVAGGGPVFAAAGKFLDTMEGAAVETIVRAFLPAGAGDIRTKLARLEAAISAQNVEAAGPVAEFPLRHHFGHKVYGRELLIPKGSVLVGKIHKFATINVLLAGDISVLTENGVKRLQAPQILVSGPGMKRAGYAHEHTIWVTFHGSEKTDLAELEDELIAQSWEEFDAMCAQIEERK